LDAVDCADVAFCISNKTAVAKVKSHVSDEADMNKGVFNVFDTGR